MTLWQAVRDEWRTPQRLTWLIGGTAVVGGLATLLLLAFEHGKHKWVWIAVVLSCVTLLDAGCVALLRRVGHDDGLSLEDLEALASLGRTRSPGNDRGTDALKTIYTWREDQWRQVSKGLAGAVLTLVVALVPLLFANADRETTYAPAVTSASGQLPLRPAKAAAGQRLSPTALTALTVKTSSSTVPPALFVVLADLLGLAVFAGARARSAQKGYTHDIRVLAVAEGQP